MSNEIGSRVALRRGVFNAYRVPQLQCAGNHGYGARKEVHKGWPALRLTHGKEGLIGRFTGGGE